MLRGAEAKNDGEEENIVMLSWMISLFCPNPILFNLASGFLLGVQIQMFWEPALLVAFPLMTILHAADALIVECLFWSVTIVRYALPIAFL